MAKDQANTSRGFPIVMVLVVLSIIWSFCSGVGVTMIWLSPSFSPDNTFVVFGIFIGTLVSLFIAFFFMLMAATYCYKMGSGRPLDLWFLRKGIPYRFLFTEQIKGNWWASITEESNFRPVLVSFQEKPRLKDMNQPFTVSFLGRNVILHQGEMNQTIRLV